MFQHEFLDIPHLKSEMKDGKRKYITPAGDFFPSITTVLKEMSDKTEINKWKERVGEKEAKRISASSMARGTSLHSVLEDYLMNKEIDFKKVQPVNLMMFRQVQGILDKHVDKIYGIETTLYSDKLKVCGKCDLIADYDGVHSLIDFKNAKRRKKSEHIHDYFLQETFYSCCLLEKQHFICPQIITIIAIEDDPPQVFIEPQLKYLPDLVKMLREYHSRFSA